MSKRKTQHHKTQRPPIDAIQVDPGPLNQLVRAIDLLPGEKHLTLTITDGRLVEMYIDASGRYGETGLIEKSLFCAKLVTAMHIGGGMIIRQLTPLKAAVDCPVHGTYMKPICNIYGVALRRDQWMVLPAEDVEWAHTHDARTGEAMDREPNVRFLTLPLPAA